MKIICVGDTNTDSSMNTGLSGSKDPYLFLRSETSIIRRKLPFFLPDFSSDIRAVVSPVLRISKTGKNIPPGYAKNYYKEIALGVSFVAHDLLLALSQQGLPWEKATSFDGSTAVSPFHAVSDLPVWQSAMISLSLNARVVAQHKMMENIHAVDQLIAYASTFFTIKIGDLVFLPPVHNRVQVKGNDHLEAMLNEAITVSVKVK